MGSLDYLVQRKLETLEPRFKKYGPATGGRLSVIETKLSEREFCALVREALYEKPPSTLSVLRRPRVEVGEYLAYSKFGMVNVVKHEYAGPEELWRRSSLNGHPVELSCADFKRGTFIYKFQDHAELHMKKRKDELILSLGYSPLKPGKCDRQQVEEVLAERFKVFLEMALSLEF